MRSLEAAFIFFVSGAVLLQLSPPPYTGNAFLQQFVLANDIYISMYENLGSKMFDAGSEAEVRDFIETASRELSLCIYYSNGHYEVETCEVKEGAFIERQVMGQKVLLGVGKQ